MSDFGDLERVDLREAWANEATQFTPWVAENLALLGDAIGISLELEQTEKPVGSFSADVLCRDTLTSRPVLIENQIERTDHTHLGQTITYAAGIGASTVVWVAAQFREEHRAALDWLNEHTDEDLAFFGLEIEVWRIGASAMAPKFNVVCKPNDWARQVHAAAINPAAFTETQSAQVEFWTKFVEFTHQRQSPLRSGTPGPYNWVGHPVGRSGFVLNSVWSTYNSATNSFCGEIREDLVLSTTSAKENYARLLERKDEVETALREHGVTEEIHWYNPENAQLCRVYVRRDANIENRDDWANQERWLLDRAEAFLAVFGPVIRKL
ncbi:MAG: DUF4268 domain-containing protein [Candidatus Krumholzibacteria bacterium]|nr:DUF4268 domain-containing protein [Candidatus Krumholzibacteria bacterium]